eukprot:s8504_g2.t1
MWGGVTSLQTLQYTLHSMKVTLLAFFRQLDFSLETRHLQGHHTFAASSTLYGRDDVSPLILAQDSFITRVLQGLAFFRQLDFSLETRHLQGHHTFAASSTLYGRDDVSPLILAQDSFITRVLQGWRARTPIMRGVTFMPSEPPLVWAQEIGSVEELDRPTAGSSPLAGKSDQLHSASVSELPPALPEVPQAPPLEGETSSDSGEDLGAPEEITFLCAECSCILHAGIAGRELAAAFSQTWTERLSILKKGVSPSCIAFGCGRLHVVATLLTFISIAAMTTPTSPVTPKEHIRDPQPLKDSLAFVYDTDDSLAFVYDTDVHQLSSFIRSGPPLGRTKLLLALGLSFQAPGSRISGPPAPEGSIPPKEKEKGEKVEKKVEEDPPSIHKDVDKEAKSAPSYQEDRDEEWDDNSWNQSWGGGWSWHYRQ